MTPTSWLSLPMLTPATSRLSTTRVRLPSVSRRRCSSRRRQSFKTIVRRINRQSALASLYPQQILLVRNDASMRSHLSKVKRKMETAVISNSKSLKTTQCKGRKSASRLRAATMSRCQQLLRKKTTQISHHQQRWLKRKTNRTPHCQTRLQILKRTGADSSSRT